MKGLIFLCFVLHLRELVSADYVPVIIWGPQVQHESAVALKPHCYDEFLDVLRKHSTVDTITFIVIEDRLSVEDLSHCRAPNGQTCFRGIQSIDTKLYLPYVDDPAYVIEAVALKEGDIFEINLLSSGNFSESLKNRTGKYVYVNFGDDSYTNETMSEKLTRHDQMISPFYKKFVSQNDRHIAVVFTGRRNADRKRFLRQVSMPFSYFEANISANPATANNVWKTESVLLYYTSVDLKISNETMWMNVTSMSVKAANGKNTDDALDDIEYYEDYADYRAEEDAENQEIPTENEGSNATAAHTATHLLVTMYVNVKHTLRFVITTSNGYWRAHQFTWNNESLVPNTPISAPNGFSYHCAQAITIINRNAMGQNGTASGQDETKTGPNRSEIVITFEGLQLQPKFVYVKGEMIASFSDAYDCVGFVSSGILSGLVVVFLLVFILFIGILCIMDIKSNDRFEDPKGPRMMFTINE